MGFYSASITTDASGDATVTEWNGTFNGLLMGIRVDGDGFAATADITVSEPNGLGRTILTLTDTNTDTVYNPKFIEQDNTGTDLSSYEPYLLDDTNLQVIVAQGGNATSGTVTVLILE